MIKETQVFSGLICEVVHSEQPDGRIFEQCRRPPGVRLIIVSNENKILITKEHRDETGGVDLRLPGGKVCDTLDEWHKLPKSDQSIIEAAKEAAIKEGLQETGLIIKDPELITTANSGATVKWDLFYFLVRDYSQSPGGQELELGENIEITWMDPAEIRSAVLDQQMNEWRSVGVVLGLVLPKLENH